MYESTACASCGKSYAPLFLLACLLHSFFTIFSLDLRNVPVASEVEALRNALDKRTLALQARLALFGRLGTGSASEAALLSPVLLRLCTENP